MRLFQRPNEKCVTKSMKYTEWQGMFIINVETHGPIPNITPSPDYYYSLILHDFCVGK